MKIFLKLLKKCWPAKIRYQLVLGIALVHLLLMTVFVFILVNEQQDYLQKQNLEQTESLAETFAVNAVSGVLSNDLQGLEEIVESHKEFPNLKYAMIMSEDGLVLAHTNRMYIGMKLSDKASSSLKKIPEKQILVDDGLVLDVAVPVLSNNKEIVGWVRIGQGQEQIYAEMRDVSRNGILFTLMAVIVGVLLAVIIAKLLSRNLNKLLAVTNEIKKGNRDLRALDNDSFEVTELGRSINQMVDEIIVNEKALQQSVSLLTATLESTADGILVTDFYGHIISYNEKFAELWNIPSRILDLRDNSNALSYVLDELKDPEEFIRLIRELDSQPTAVHFYSFEFKDGRIFERYSQPQIINGEFVGRVWSFRDVTRRKKAEESLAQSEERFRSVVENANDLIFLLTKEGLLMYNSPNLKEMLGYEANEFIGQPVLNFLIHPDDIEACRGFIELTFVTREKQSGIEYRILHKNGFWRWHRTNASLIHDVETDRYVYLGIARDITDERLLEEQIIKQKNFFEQTFSQSSISTQILDKDGWCERINPKLTELFGVLPENIEGKQYNIFDDEAIRQAGLIPKLKKVFYEGKSVEWDVLFDIGLAAKSQNITVAENKKRWFHNWAYPIFDKNDQIVNVIIQHSDITERKIAEDALKESEDKFSKTFHISPDVILISRFSDGLIVDLNDRAVEFGGFSREEAIGMKTIDWNRWESLSEKNSARNEFVSILTSQGQVTNYERQFITKSGEIRDTSISAEIIELKGETYIMTVIHDITQRRKIENEIKERITQLQTLGDNLPNTIIYQVVLELNGQMRFTYISRGIEKIINRPSEEILQDSELFYGLVIEEDRQLMLDTRKKNLIDLSTYSVEVRLRDFQGDVRWFLIQSIPRKTPDGWIIWDGVIIDINEKKISDEKLKNSEELLNQTGKMAKVGGWNLNVLTGELDWTKEIYKLAEVDDDYVPDVSKVLDLYHPDDREMLKNLIDNATRVGEGFDTEIRVVTAKGNHVWARTIVYPTLADGKVVRLSGVVQDITERKKAEDALFASLQEISDYKYALDQATIISITDEKGIIKYVNSNFCKMYGYTAEEAIGKNHNSIVKSGYHPDSFWKNFWLTIQSGKVLKAEVCNRSREGDLYWQDTTIIPFLNEDGKPYQYLAIRTDITEKRELEKKLAEEQLNNQKIITEVTIQAQEKEKSDLGSELHDNINQILATVKMYLGMIKSKQEKPDELIGMSYNYVDKAIEEIRKLSHSLVAPSMGDIGLTEALKELIAADSKVSGLKVKLVDKMDPELTLLDNKKLMLYRIVQEQMNNVIKYAKAKNVKIYLVSENNNLRLTISDDGVGFDTSKKMKGIGLKNIQNRVEFYFGKLEIVSSIGKGCTLDITIPY